MEVHEVIASAPTKTILFGEHAVVYGAKAVAMSLGLRTYAHVNGSAEGLNVLLPNVGEEAVISTDELSKHVQEGDVVEYLKSNFHPSVAAVAKVYVEVCNIKSGDGDEKVKFFPLKIEIVADDVPMGAGLGSSASLCVAAAAAFTSALNVPCCDGGKEVIECEGCRTGNMCKSRSELVCQMALHGEKIMHGNPSGLDNTICTYGGALVFTKQASKAETKALNIPPMKLLLTDSRVKRDTAKLVKNIEKKKKDTPKEVEEIIEKIGKIGIDIENLMQEYREANRPKFLQKFGYFMDMNHKLLVDLGVSHPRIQKIFDTAKLYKMPTKLTGAGGGGCVLTLLPDGHTEEVDNLVGELNDQGFSCYSIDIDENGKFVTSLSNPPSSLPFGMDESLSKDILSSDKVFVTLPR